MAELNFHPGVKPNDPSKARLYFRMFAKAGVTPPPTVDYSGFSPVGMLGNDRVGDCVYAADGHIVEQVTFYGQGSEYVVSTEQALAAYSQQTGYNPADPNSDQGDTVQNGLDFARKQGFGGHKVAAFAQLDVRNMTEVKTAIAEFGSVDIGFYFPESAMSQFNQGKPWTPVANSPIEGGHCVTVTGYTDSYLTCITWGKTQKMDYAFWNKYVEEAWAIISQEWWNSATNKDPEGVDLAALGAQWSALTGQPNPFPDVPTPTPPPPEPTPVPVGPDADELALIQAAAKYEETRRPKRYLVTALENWAARFKQ
jgi:hypothetical protein